MSDGVRKQYIGNVRTGERWSDIYKNTTALPILPGTQNLRSFHITDSEEKAI